MRLAELVLIAAASSAIVERAAAEAPSDKSANIDMGGAIRLAHSSLDHGPSSGPSIELISANLLGKIGSLSLSAEYRWYEDFKTVHHSYVSWVPGENFALKVGIQKVPFGLLPMASQGFWAGSGYYLGIEDDYDQGFVLTHRRGDATLHLGWFLGDEYGTGSRYERYSFDVATTDELPYRERGRLHARLEHSANFLGVGVLLGASGFSGKVQNTVSGQAHDHWGAAIHSQLTHGDWTLQIQSARYVYAVPNGRIAMSGLQFPFKVAARSDVSTVNIAYSFGSQSWLDNVTCYNNLSITRPLMRSGSRESWQNVTGCSIRKGIMLTYVDWIAGKNMVFLGGDGIGLQGERSSQWNSRLNLNVGFYF
ncbi:hypothetical protein JAK51_11790 [Stenotrophomonas maltophilia]|nr:hypothetical protein [Stenotrophomonas maltophilia]